MKNNIQPSATVIMISISIVKFIVYIVFYFIVYLFYRFFIPSIHHKNLVLSSPLFSSLLPDSLPNPLLSSAAICSSLFPKPLPNLLLNPPITITFNYFITICNFHSCSLFYINNMNTHVCTCSEPSSASGSPCNAECEAPTELRPDVAEPAAAPQALALAHGEKCQQQDDGQNWYLHLVRCVSENIFWNKFWNKSRVTWLPTQTARRQATHHPLY